MYRSLLLLLFCNFSLLAIFGQQYNTVSDVSTKVFYIGEDEKEYEKLVRNYNVLLFTVCENNMEKAFDNWSVLLKDIEDFSVKSNVDLKGVKFWMNVFWDKNGTIDYIVFYPKPNSKNMNYDLIKSMLASFVKSYQSPLKHATKFSHYGSAAFPIISRSVVGQEK
ncbi:MAG: hypothetical protein WBP08_17765 [Saprospiraceae bacterium]